MLALVALIACMLAAPLATSTPARHTRAVEPRFTWSANFLDGALARSEARVQAATLDANENVVIAGSVTGPLQIGRGLAFSDDQHERAFLAKIDRRGRLVWLHGLGSRPRSGMLSELGVTALVTIGNEIVAIGAFSVRGDSFLEGGEPAHQLISRIDQRGLPKRTAPLNLPEILSVVPGPDRDLYVAGCRRRWLAVPGPGNPPTLHATGGFVARVAPSGAVRWRKQLRESGADVPPRGTSIGPIGECVTELMPTGDGGVAAGGIFSGPFRIAGTILASDDGTFLARFSAGGNLEWARTVATRLVTSSYDDRPQFGALPGGAFVGAGVMPTAQFPKGGSGAALISPDGRDVWSRAVETGTGCCNVDSPLATASRRAVVIAGTTAYGRSITFGGRTLIDSASSDAFVLWVREDGSPSGATTLPESATELSRVVAGRTGIWVVGTQRNGAAGTGIFAHWIPR